MTKEEAFEKLEVTVGIYLMSGNADNTYCREWREILETLKQEPCEDTISRQTISEYVKGHIQEINAGYGDLNSHTNRILRMIVDYIENMPKAGQKPKQGHWIWNIEHTYCKCSKCGIGMGHTEYDYCPNCGCRMSEVSK